MLLEIYSILIFPSCVISSIIICVFSIGVAVKTYCIKTVTLYMVCILYLQGSNYLSFKSAAVCSVCFIKEAYLISIISPDFIMIIY